MLRLYNIELALVGVFTFVMVLLIAWPIEIFYANWIRGIIDLFILMWNAIVLRSGLSHNRTFFHKLYSWYRYEFKRHIRREAAKQILLILAFILLDLTDLVIVF